MLSSKITLTRHSNKQEAQDTGSWKKREWKSSCFLGSGATHAKVQRFCDIWRKCHRRNICLSAGSLFLLSLGIIRSLCDRETGNCLAWSRVEKSSLQASLCRNVFRGTLEWDFREGRSFTFVCWKKNIFLVGKKFLPWFPIFSRMHSLQTADKWSLFGVANSLVWYCPMKSYGVTGDFNHTFLWTP